MRSTLLEKKFYPFSFINDYSTLLDMNKNIRFIQLLQSDLYIMNIVLNYYTLKSGYRMYPCVYNVIMMAFELTIEKTLISKVRITYILKQYLARHQTIYKYFSDHYHVSFIIVRFIAITF